MDASDMPPALAESSDDDSDMLDDFPEKYFGRFPWGRKRTKRIKQQVNMWMQLDEEYVKGVKELAVINLTSLCIGKKSPTMFLSAKCHTWAKTLLRIRDPLPVGITTADRLEEEMVMWRMMQKANVKMFSIAKRQTELIEILNFVQKASEAEDEEIEIPLLLHAHGHAQFQLVCDCIQAAVQSYGDREAIVLNEKTRGKTYKDSSLYVALVVTKQFADVLDTIAYEGRDVVRESNLVRADTGKMLRFKDMGNEFFKKQDYMQALKVYTEAIETYPYSPVLFCNRCIAALKLTIYDLAVLDGYRATSLQPDWGKAYHRRAEALKNTGRLQLAIETDLEGLENCRNPSERIDLQKQLASFREIESQKNKMEQRDQNGKAPIRSISKNGSIISQGELPELVSEDDSVKDFSDGESSNVAQKKQKKTELKKQKAQQSAPKGKSMKTKEGIIKKERTSSSSPAPKERFTKISKQNSGEHVKQRTSSESKKESTEKENKAKAKEEEKKKKRKQQQQLQQQQQQKQQQNKIERPLAVDTKVFVGDVYHSHVSIASRALFEKRHYDAISDYDVALKIVNESNHREWKITAVENFVLIYARGICSLDTGRPLEIGKSLDFFSRIIRPQNPKEYCHPMAAYASARAQYNLNNFSKVPSEIEKGMEQIKNKSFPGVLTWPGISEVIPESNVDYLKQRMKALLSNSQDPPRPDVVCRYDNCSKEYAKREIYFSDLDFEGFIYILCDWQCETRFHYKCWSKFKHDNFQKSGDKELLGLSCFTDGCLGLICEIRMMNEENLVKKEVNIRRRKMEKVNGDTSYIRPSKSERNLLARKRSIQEAKEKRAAYKEAANFSLNVEEMETQTTKEKENVRKVSESDIAIAKIIKKDDETVQENVKLKSKGKGKSKKKSNNMSLQTFLSESNSKAIDDAKQAIERINNSKTPFKSPDDFQFEMNIESSNAEEEQYKLASLYSFFEEFFKRNGPTRLDDNALRKEITTERLSIILQRFSNFESFIKSNSTFVIKESVAFLKNQEEMTKTRSLKTNTTSAGPSKSSSNSEFLEEFLKVGDVPLNDIKNITGKPKKDPTPAGQVFQQNKTVLKISKPEGGDGKKLKKLSVKPVKQASKENVNKGDLGRMMKLNGLDVQKKLDEMLSGASGAISHGIGKTLNPRMAELSTNNSSNNDNIEPTTAKKSLPEPSNVAMAPSSSGNGSGSSSHTGNRASGKVKLKKLNSKTVTVDKTKMPKLQTSSNATQTELIPSYEKLIETLEGDKRLLQERISEQEDKLTCLTKTSRTELSALSKEVRELKAQLGAAMVEATSATQSCDTEVKKAQKDKSSWQETAKVLKKQLKEAQDSQINAQNQVTEKQKELDKLSAAIQRQREDGYKYNFEHTTEVRKLEETIKETKERAVLAELTTLETQENFGVINLRRAKAECDKFAGDLEQLSHQHAQNPAMKSKVLEASLQWKKNADECQRRLDQTRKLFADQSLQVRRGQVLSELPLINVPSPPPPGPNLHQLSMLLMRNPPQFFASNKFANMPLSVDMKNITQPMMHVNNGIDTTKVHQRPQMGIPQSPWNDAPVRAPLTPVGSEQQPLWPSHPVTEPSVSSDRDATTTAFFQNHHQQQTVMSKPATMPNPVTTTNQMPVQDYARQQVPVSASTNQLKQPAVSSTNHTPPIGHVKRPSSSSPAPPQHKGSFERIMGQLEKMYPSFSRSELAQCIKEVRQNNNNSLTGLSLEEIVKQASQVISKKASFRKATTVPSTAAPARPMTSSSVAPWIQGKKPKSGIIGTDSSDDEPCVICHDPLDSNNTHRLLCGHVFHRECLNKWLTRNRTCPTCRDYAIDTSEYPTLKSTLRK